MAKLTKELINSAPWDEIREHCKTHMIKDAFELFIDGKYPITLKQFRGHCAQKLITSPISEEERNREISGKARKEKVWRPYSEEEKKAILASDDNQALALELGRTPKAIRQQRSKLLDDAKKKIGRGKGREILDSIDWKEVIRWTDEKDARNMKHARAKFAPRIYYYAFTERMNSERKKIQDRKVNINIMPVAIHNQLRPMYGRYAA